MYYKVTSKAIDGITHLLRSEIPKWESVVGRECWPTDQTLCQNQLSVSLSIAATVRVERLQNKASEQLSNDLPGSEQGPHDIPPEARQTAPYLAAPHLAHSKFSIIATFFFKPE